MALIEREALVREILSLTIIDDTAAAYLDVVLDRINRASTIDPAPVVHGQWRRPPMSDTLFCSACDRIQLGQRETPYCPLCGARMDGGEDDG